jgi:hypothetical protein
MDDQFEVLDAFVDGERVDAAQLRRALADEDGRDYFIDAWLLRESVQDELMREPVPQIALSPRSGRHWPLLAVAASIVCLVGGGFAGYRLADRPGASPAAPAIVEAPAAAPALPAPQPTRAIPVEFSTDNAAARGGD